MFLKEGVDDDLMVRSWTQFRQLSNRFDVKFTHQNYKKKNKFLENFYEFRGSSGQECGIPRNTIENKTFLLIYKRLFLVNFDGKLTRGISYSSCPEPPQNTLKFLRIFFILILSGTLRIIHSCCLEQSQNSHKSKFLWFIAPIRHRNWTWNN